jgi:putative Mg2+ transporter-C (MgtC) family protein
MDAFLIEVQNGWLSWPEFARVVVRLLTAMTVGAVAGIDRERMGKAAGLRTHMLVAVGSALFVLAPSLGGMGIGDMSRVIQGVAAGVGFIGGGAILKSAQNQEIHGLTTAASVWLTAAGGVAAGLGRIGVALVTAGMAWLILSTLSRAERWLDRDDSNRA